MLKKKRKKITILIFILTAIFAISNFALAAKPKVVFWSYAANNIEEWKKREAAIEKKFNIDLQIEQVAQAAFVQKLQATMMDGARYPDIIEWMIETNKILDANPKKCLVTPLDKYQKRCPGTNCLDYLRWTCLWPASRCPSGSIDL
jgi:ABC-type glycerol-3-phosphate transport system substrate-binding protein